MPKAKKHYFHESGRISRFREFQFGHTPKKGVFTLSRRACRTTVLHCLTAVFGEPGSQAQPQIAERQGQGKGSERKDRGNKERLRQKRSGIKLGTDGKIHRFLLILSEKPRLG